MRRLALVGILSLVALNLTAPGARATSGPIDLGTLGGTESVAIDVSGDIVAGRSQLSNGTTHPFVYDLGAATPTMQDLGTLGGTFSTATDVSGDIVVGYSSLSGVGQHAFLYDLGATAPTMQDLGTLGGVSSNAVAVNGDVVVGGSMTGGGENHAFAYDVGATTPSMRDLGSLGGAYSEARAVSGDLVVGYSHLGDGQIHAFVYDLAGAPAMVDLGTLGGPISYATAVSGKLVAGHSTRPGGETHAYAYDLGAATPTLRDLGALAGNTSAVVTMSGNLVVGLSYTSSEGSPHAVAWIVTPITETTTTLASSANPSIIGAQVTYTASVTPVPDGGTIAFNDGATTITGCGSQSIDASGQATCQATHTDVGTRSLTAEYSGNLNYAASASSPHGQDVAYAIKVLYDPTKAGRGNAIVKLRLEDAAQNNLSSSAITLTVTGLSPSPAPGTPPTGNFTFVTARKGSGYQLLVNTKDYPAGTYTLSFTAGADPTTHTASFIVK